MLWSIIHNNFTQTFPNIFVALRIYCSMIATSCEGERSFSTLKRVKNCLLSTVGQVCVSTLALLCVESELMKQIDFSEVIASFANQKARKKVFQQGGNRIYIHSSEFVFCIVGFSISKTNWILQALVYLKVGQIAIYRSLFRLNVMFKIVVFVTLEFSL